MATVAVPVDGRAKKPARLWWHVHQWVGLKLSILLSFVLLTGTFATISHEIDWLIDPAIRVAPASVTGEPDWAAIVVTAAKHPATASIESVDAPIASAFAAGVTIKNRDGERRYLWIHPTTGQLQGDSTWFNVARILRDLHRRLNIDYGWGITLVSALAALLAVSLVTSLVVYKRWWRGFWKPIRWRDARTALGDAHRLAGVWSMAFVLVITATGLWYLLESLGGEAPRLSGPAQKPGPVIMTNMAKAEALPRALASVRGRDPGLRITSLSLPDNKTGAFVFRGQREALLVRERANTAWVSADGRRLLHRLDGQTLSVHQRISEMADPLHFGTMEWGHAKSWWVRWLWFVFGLMLTGLSVSGVAIHVTRIAREGRTAASLRSAFANMGWWRWPAATLVAGSLVLVVLRLIFRTE